MLFLSQQSLEIDIEYFNFYVIQTAWETFQKYCLAKNNQMLDKYCIRDFCENKNPRLNTSLRL